MNSRDLAAVLLTAALPVCAADWPQYAGPSFNRATPEKIQKIFPASGPKTVWRVPTAGGFSSFTVSGGKAFTQVMRDFEGAPRETVIALHADTGKELWVAPLGGIKINDGGQSGTPDNSGGDGPRSTPGVDGSRVYVNSAKRVLTCFDAASGKVAWSHDLIKEFAGPLLKWENAASPLLEGGLVFVGGGGPGESLLAFDKASGKVVWKAHDEILTHATPVVATILGQKQIVFFMQSGLVAVNPADGALLWRHHFRYSTSSAASPVVADDMVYCAAAYGVGATAVKISKKGGAFKATELWITHGNEPVANHWSTPVYFQGHLYGMFMSRGFGVGPLKCVELATGQVKWSQPNYGPGQVILAGDTLLALSDKGELVTVEASPNAYKEISRAKVVTGKCWSSPVVANGRIYLRSTKEGVCLEAGAAMAAR